MTMKKPRMLKTDLQVNSIELFEKNIQKNHMKLMQVNNEDFNVSRVNIEIGKECISKYIIKNTILAEYIFPRNVLTFIYFLKTDKSNFYNGQKVKAGDLIIVSEKKVSIHLITPNTHMIIIQIPQNNINNINNKCVIYKSYFLKKLLSKLDNLICTTKKSFLSKYGLVYYKSILKKLFDILNREDNKNKRNYDTRNHYLKIALILKKYVDNHSFDLIGIADLCQITGQRERTLERICNHIFGMPPKKLIKLCRLNSIHLVLVNYSGESKLNITRLAMEYGFMNTGRFAKDYKELFGKLPSQMLSAG